MEFHATDQFGNLYIGESDAQSFEELTPHVHQLVDAVRERSGDDFKICVDMDYKEILGPDPDKVSHIVRVPWLSNVDGPTAKEAVDKIVKDYVGS